MRSHRVGWRIDAVERILREFGFELKNQRGSDRVYKNEDTGVRYFISHHGAGQIKPGYIRSLVDTIDRSQKIEREPE